MQTFENLLLQTCTFTNWKLILSNNEEYNNDININNNIMYIIHLDDREGTCICMDHKWKTEIRKLAVLHDDMILWSMMINTCFFYSSPVWELTAIQLGTYVIGEILVQSQFEHKKFDANLWKSSSPKLHKKILIYYIQIVFEYVLSKFVQMVAPPTLLAK